MTHRTDIHRPSAIVPRDYRFVALDYFGPAGNDPFLMAHRAAYRADKAATGGRVSDHEHGGTCHICGAAALYVARFHHAATNTYITTGTDCASNMHMGDPNAFRRFRVAMGKARVAEKGKRKAEKTLADAGLAKAWEVYTADYSNVTGGLPYEEATICDIVGKLVKYGSVTDKAMGFVRSLVERIPARERIANERAAATAAAAPVPVSTERMVVTGEVLSVKERETRFGLVNKMLVKHRDGWKVWGTVPSALNVARGDTVTFEAAVTASREDPKFGFFNRPTKAAVERALAA